MNVNTNTMSFLYCTTYEAKQISNLRNDQTITYRVGNSYKYKTTKLDAFSAIQIDFRTQEIRDLFASVSCNYNKHVCVLYCTYTTLRHK